jgi:hypothetical protein
LTVSTTTSRADYNGNGTTTAFAVPFYFLDQTHLTVLRTQISTGVITTLTLTTNYTVTGAGVFAGGTVTCLVAPTADQKLSILRNVPLTQLNTYVPNDPFPAASHERALDQLTMEVQQLDEAIDRALTLPANTVAGSVSATLPTPEANKFIGWNSAANGLQNLDASTLATVTSYGSQYTDQFSGNGVQTQFTLSQNPGSINNLLVSISGVLQRPTIDYTYAGSTAITFTSAPASGTNNIMVKYGSTVPQGGAIVNADVDASAAIALSKLATQGARTFVANSTASTAVPTAISVATAQGMVGQFDTVSAVNSATIDAGINHIRTSGYNSAGDGGGALYKRISTPSPVKDWHKTSNGGTVYWELAEALPNVLMFGATGNGSTDDSDAFQDCIDYAAASGRATVIIPGPAGSNQYLIKNINIPNGINVIGYGTYIKTTGLSSVTHVFKLTGFNTRLMGVYINQCTECTTAAIVLDTGTGMSVRDVAITNATNCLKIAPAVECKEFVIDNVRAAGFTGVGFWIGPDSNEGSFSNCHADPGQETGTGGYRPKTDSTGFLADATGSTKAFGGHLYANCLAINCETGWDLAFTELSLFTNCVADGCSGAGISIGRVNECNNLHFNNTFIGACGRAIAVSNNSTRRVFFYGLQTENIGVIPSGGGTDYYSHAGVYSSPWYDISQSGTAYVTVDVDQWNSFGTNAYQILEANVNYIQTLGGVHLQFNSEGNIAANTTKYVGRAGAVDAADELNTVNQLPLGNSWVLNASRVLVYTGNAPGSGQSYTYTIRDGGVDTAITATQSGTGVFTATFSGGPVTFTGGDNISLKVVTSATAATTRYRGNIQLWPKAL